MRLLKRATWCGRFAGEIHSIRGRPFERCKANAWVISDHRHSAARDAETGRQREQTRRRMSELEAIVTCRCTFYDYLIVLRSGWHGRAQAIIRKGHVKIQDEIRKWLLSRVSSLPFLIYLYNETDSGVARRYGPRRLFLMLSEVEERCKVALYRCPERSWPRISSRRHLPASLRLCVLCRTCMMP
jgi:hypothetical protein